MKQEQAVTMAAKLYECRDTARRLFGEGYQARMDSYGQIIRSIAKTTGTSELSAAISAAKKVEGMASICFLAAAVEMAEPSNDSAQRLPAGHTE